MIITINISTGGDANVISKSETFDNITKHISPPIQSYGVMVSTTVFGAVGPSSNLGKTTITLDSNISNNDCKPDEHNNDELKNCSRVINARQSNGNIINFLYGRAIWCSGQVG